MKEGIQGHIRATVRSRHEAAKCAPLSGNELITLDAIADYLVTTRDRLVDVRRDEAGGHEGELDELRGLDADLRAVRCLLTRMRA